MNCIIVDDEPMGREGLADYVTEIDQLKLVGLCKNAIEANNLMAETKVDLIFLDIQMPKLSGLEFIRSLENPPLIIICTAYPSYAIEGYDLNVLDYLVKPITYQRFLKACNKAKTQFQLINNSNEPSSVKENFFFVKCDNQFVKIIINDILYIESLQNYISIKCQDKNYVTLISLKNVLKELPESSFMQIHKSYVVNLDTVQSIEGNQLIINEDKIPISRSLRKEVYDRVLKNKVLKK